jgi:PAS domain S-box-containing protein
MSLREYPDSFETTTGVLAATQGALLTTTHELHEVRAKLATATAAAETLRKALELRDAALDAGSSHFMIVDLLTKGRPIIYVNRALAHEHGYEPEQLIGQSVNMLTVKSDAAAPQQQPGQFYKDIASGQTVRTEIQAVRRDGSTFWVGVCSTPLRNAQGVVTHYVTVGADITARMEAERKKKELQEQLVSEMRERERIGIELRLAQKLESVGRLAAGLAHEINTPIQYVGDSVYFLQSAFADISRLLNAYRDAMTDQQAMADAAVRESALAAINALQGEIDYEFLSVEVPKAFQRTLEGAERVTGIVRAMKEFAHPDSAEHTPADLNQGLRTTLVVASNEYKYDAIVSMQAGDIPLVKCNLGELNQVFLNLIVNAAHAIRDSSKDAGTGCINVDTRVDGGFAEIAISDNGCGIAPENVEKIFDPFFTTKEVGRGTGQGLAIARSIVVDKHGGDIRVESDVGVGTRFVLRLPVEGRAERPDAVRSDSMQPDSIQQHP